MIQHFVNEVLQHQHFKVFMGKYYGENTKFGQHLLTKLFASHVENFKNPNLIKSFENLSGIDVVSVDNGPKFCQ